MRKTKPIEEIQNLSPSQLDQLHTWFEDGHPYTKIMELFGSTFQVQIKYHKVYKYWHTWSDAKELRKHSQEKVPLLEIIAVLQGEAAAVVASSACWWRRSSSRDLAIAAS